MTDSRMRFSVVVTSANHATTLPALLDSIFEQEAQAIECRVVDEASTDGTREILRAFSARLAGCESVAPGERVAALNRAFSQMRGDIFLWLDGGDRLVPWAFRLVSFVFSRLDVAWLTSNTPVAWSPSNLCIAAGLSDGYARKPFFAGRNLKTSVYFHHPIWRNGTYWTRALWQASGSRIALPLAAAGDWELWMRFWAHADLTGISVPLAGRQMRARPETNDAYWQQATQLLKANGATPPPSRLEQAVKRFLARRFPAARARWSFRSPQVWIAPPTEECGISWHSIF